MGILKKKPKYYTLDNILKQQAQYNIIFGERSNGKTYASLDYGVRNYFEGKGKMALIRRWREDFKGKRGQSYFEALVSNGLIDKYSKGLWSGVYYYSGRWYFSRLGEDGKIEREEEPFCYAFSITEMEHDKSSSFPDVTTIIFDEFLTRGYYLPDEFVSFMNCISTIVRDRTNVKIFMLGNTVNKYCPYFNEMGLNHIKEMKQGDIEVYNYGESGLRVAVEYSDFPGKAKGSDLYFAFDNPKLKMITNGVWEVDIYPHLPRKYKPKDIAFDYFIEFDGQKLHCEIVYLDDFAFTFIHLRTTEIRDRENAFIFSPDYSPYPHHKRNILKPTTETEKKIYMFFRNEKVYYQNNEVGEIVRNYLNWCKSN